MHGNIAFVQVGHELAAQAGGQHYRAQHGQRGHGHHQSAHCHGLAHQTLITITQRAHGAMLFLLHRIPEQQGDTGRNKGHRQQHGASQCNHNGHGHGVEHLPFNTGQREDRQVHRRNDKHAKQGRTDHFPCRGKDNIQPRTLPQSLARHLRLAETPQTVLHDDNGAIHQQTEVQRPETHQVGTDPGLHHASDRHQHGDRNDCSRQQGCPDIAQQQEQDHDHQQRAFQQILLNRLQGLVDQPGAVIHRRCGYPFRQARLDFLQLLAHRAGDGTAVLTHQHEHRAHHHFTTILGSRPSAQLQPFFHTGHIFQPQACAAVGAQRGVRQRLQRGHLAGHAHQPLRPVLLNEADTPVLVIGLDRSNHLLLCHSRRQQASRVNGDQDLALVAANGIDLHHTGHTQQLWANDPVMY